MECWTILHGFCSAVDMASCFVWLHTYMACCYTIGSYIGEVTSIGPAMQVTVYLQSSHYANYTVFL